MVRLVFRPYTQVWRTICTSVPLRASIRVSPDFTLLKHSSPSFGSEPIRYNSNLSQKIEVGRLCRTKKSKLLLSLRVQVCHPHTLIRVRLLGPCFKTGRRKPFGQHPRTIVTKLIATMILSSPGLHRTITTIMPSWKSPAFLSRDKGPYLNRRNTAANQRISAVLPEYPRYVDAKP